MMLDDSVCVHAIAKMLIEVFGKYPKVLYLLCLTVKKQC